MRSWAAAAALLLLALAANALADTQGDSSPRSHYWAKDQLRSQPGKPPPPPPPPPAAWASGNQTSVPYSAAAPLHRLVQSLNGTDRGRQLIPLLLVEGGVEASAAAALDGDYLLGYSHNPWGKSAAFKDVLDDLGAGATAGAAVAGRQPAPRRRRRSVVHLYNMLVCSTGCDPMAYKGYGCYCGFLGSGYTTDGIDRCCKMHDWCYDTASCPMFLEYFVPYLWKCYRGRPLCALNGSACSQRLCECDRRLAECLRHYPCPRRKAVCTSSPWRLLQNLFML